MRGIQTNGNRSATGAYLLTSGLPGLVLIVAHVIMWGLAVALVIVSN